MSPSRALFHGALVVALVLSSASSRGAATPGAPTKPKADATWLPAGELHTGRIDPIATRLRDGRVLVAGGRRMDCCSTLLSSAEIFDPATNRWSDAADMPAALIGRGVMLNDGRVMLMGSTDNEPRLVVELYDPASNAWKLAPGPGLRTGCTMTLLASGKVLAAGGFAGNDALDTASLFDPDTATWTATGGLNDKRGGAVATLLRDGRVLILAGQVPGADIEFPVQVATAELYDPASGQWTRATSPNRVYTAPSITLLPNGRVLVLGDVGDTEQYDPVLQRWTISGTREAERSAYAYAPLQNGQVLVTGGADNRLTQRYQDGAESYDPDEGTWHAAASMATARSHHAATVLLDGRVLVTGGIGAGANGDIALRSTELYPSAAAIGPAYTGAWFNPEQSGHGLFVEVLPGQRLLAAWFTFDPAGDAAWFLGVGSYSGNTAIITAVDEPTGGRWIPNFDASRIVHHAWGSLTLTFSDCNHGVVAFSSTTGFGSGSLALTRLTLPAGLACP